MARRRPPGCVWRNGNVLPIHTAYRPYCNDINIDDIERKIAVSVVIESGVMKKSVAMAAAATLAKI